MITPAQAEAEFWSNVESKVDAVLVEAMEPPGDAETPIHVNLPAVRPHHPLDKKFVPELKSRYEASGWRVSEQPNGQLVFRRPLSPAVVDPVAEPTKTEKPPQPTPAPEAAPAEDVPGPDAK